MKKFYYIIFVLFLASGYADQCFSQTSDQYGQLPDEERIQQAYKNMQHPLYRFDGLVYIKDENGAFWQVDTTKVMVRVNGNTIPEDIDWKVSVIGWAKVPVPEGMLIEDFAASLWELPWVVMAQYNLYAGVQANDPMAIQRPMVQKEKQLNNNCYDLTGRPVSTPSKGLYIRNGKKVMFK